MVIMRIATVFQTFPSFLGVLDACRVPLPRGSRQGLVSSRTPFLFIGDLMNEFFAKLFLGFRITATEYRFLRHVNRLQKDNGVDKRELMGLLRIRKPALDRTVRSLVRKGLVVANKIDAHYWSFKILTDSVWTTTK